MSPQLKTNTLGLDSILSAASSLLSGLSRFPQEFLMAAKTRAVLCLLVGAVHIVLPSNEFLKRDRVENNATWNSNNLMAGRSRDADSTPLIKNSNNVP